jgi:hypothetical protein
MTAQVLSFLRRPAAPRDWSAQELAEFYRVESALIQAGLQVTSARGQTDEGEPWFVFCRTGDDDVIIHFARIDGRYVISSAALCGTAFGLDFRALVQSVIERQPVLQSRPRGNNLFLHPAALLVILVASALLKSGHAAEATPAKVVADVTDGKSRGVAPVAASTPAAAETAALEARHEALILAAITAAIAPVEQTEPVTITVSASAHLGFVDHPYEQPIGSALLDLPRDAAAQGAGSTTPVMPLLHSIAAPPAEATPFTLVHMAHQPDAAPGLVALNAVVPAMQTALTGALSTPPDLNAPLVAHNPEIGTQSLPLSSLSGISKVDLSLLHTLGVPDTVQYTATLPASVETVLHAGVHASVTSPETKDASPISNATASSPVVPAAAPEAAAHADATATAPAATVAAPAATVAPAAAPAAVPVLSAVLAAVEQFQAVSIHPVVVFSDQGHAVIFYDDAAVSSNLSAVKSVVYDFGDGFSISLIGLPSELSHAGVHV